MDGMTLLLLGGMIGMLLVLLIVGPNRTMVVPPVVPEYRDSGCLVMVIGLVLLLGLLLLSASGG